MKHVLFACIHNAGRSQMAAALFDALADPAQARALSAGTEPAERVHPEVVTVLAELGIEIGAVRPQRMTMELSVGVDRVVTMGCGETCQLAPGVLVEDWPLEDPKGKDLAHVRAIRDAIRVRVEALLDAQGWRGRNALQASASPAG